MKLCSACLLGARCRYDGKTKDFLKVLDLSKKELLIPVCPEQLGGMQTPRRAAEIQGGDGHDVLDGKARVVDNQGSDVSNYFIAGANEVLRLARILNIKEAILKQRSPSCGCGQVGRLTQEPINGDGVTSALLKRNGIKVISEEDL